MISRVRAANDIYSKIGVTIQASYFLSQYQWDTNRFTGNKWCSVHAENSPLQCPIHYNNQRLKQLRLHIKHVHIHAATVLKHRILEYNEKQILLHLLLHVDD